MIAPTLISETARAKINLTLHVGAPRADGYHPIDSVVMFAAIGDVVTAQKARENALHISGPFGFGLEAGEDNLVLKAAQASGLPPAKFTLTKNLPVASGIGGGSADAAAAIRALQKLSGRAIAPDMLLSLGADVPVCYRSLTCTMRGIGEVISLIDMPACYPAVLVNPRKAVSTAAIFNAFDTRYPDAPNPVSAFGASPLDMALAGRNDLQDIACEIEPSISHVLRALQGQSGAKLTRMSGSGATCFAIFETQAQAQDAAKTIEQDNTDWWCVSTTLGDSK